MKILVVLNKKGGFYILLKFLGHACFLLQTESTTLIIDPFLDNNPQAAMKSKEIKTDWILVTHGHSDHLGDAVPIAKSNAGTIICNSEIARYCRNFLEQKYMECISEVNITLVTLLSR